MFSLIMLAVILCSSMIVLLASCAKKKGAHSLVAPLPPPPKTPESKGGLVTAAAPAPVSKGSSLMNGAEPVKWATQASGPPKSPKVAVKSDAPLANAVALTPAPKTPPSQVKSSKTETGSEKPTATATESEKPSMDVEVTEPTNDQQSEQFPTVQKPSLKGDSKLYENIVMGIV